MTKTTTETISTVKTPGDLYNPIKSAIYGLTHELYREAQGALSLYQCKVRASAIVAARAQREAAQCAASTSCLPFKSLGWRWPAR